MEISNELIVKTYPKSSVSESIKTIRTNLRFSSVSEKIKTILITSSIAGEGKSFVSSNLAATYALAKEKVLLIDCDLRRGRQHQIFNLEKSNQYGLSKLLIEDLWKLNLSKYIQKTSIKNLDVMTTGPVPPNPTVLLESKKMEELIEILKKEYDIIIFDTPPVVGLTDALIISRLSDANIIVAKAKKATPELLENSKKALENVNANIVGVILTNADKKDNKYYKDYYCQS